MNNKIPIILLLFFSFIYTFSVHAQSDWNLVSGGNGHTIAIKKDGTLWGWGGANVGQLGDGSTKNKNYPLQIDSTTTWLDIEAGIAHTIAIKADGTLWGWGYNNTDGRVGVGGQIVLKPTRIGTDNDWKTISAGGYHTLAIKKNGTLWAWGSNEFGQLGTNAISGYTYNPTKIGKDSNWIAVSAGAYFSIGLKRDSTIWTWGYNKWYQLGDGSDVDKNYPVKIGKTSDWILISAGGENGHAIKSDGTLWAWGYNNSGNLGDSTKIDKKEPIQIGKGNKWKSISKGDGGGFSIAMKTDSSIWTWGYNNWGQIGDGSSIDRLVPYKIDMSNKWAKISGGGGHALAIDIEGNMWAWGENSYGQLGDATNLIRKKPVIINSCNSNFTTASKSIKMYYYANKSGLTNLKWDFGDGYKSNTKDSGNHIYAKSGTYTVCLEIKCSSKDSSRTCQPITIKSNNCKSQFSSLVDSSDKFKFKFTITSPNSTFNYNWKFGDGNSGNIINPSYTYKGTGNYNVCLYTIDTATICSDSICQKVIIGNNGCDLTYSVIAKADSLFYDYSGIGKTVKWMFGDDSISTTKKGVHIYKDYGRKYLCLKSYCSTSDSSQKCEYKYFCKAGYIKYIDPKQKYQIQMKNVSKPNYLETQYLWDFGDGGTSTVRNPTHKYTTFGKFLVCITVKIGGASSQFCDSLGLDSAGNLLKAGTWELRVTDKDPPVGISEVLKEDLKIYPNPANNKIYIELISGVLTYNKLEILNSNGQKCLSMPVDIGSEPFEVNVEKLNKGLYLVKLMNDEGYIFTKMIKN